MRPIVTGRSDIGGAGRDPVNGREGSGALRGGLRQGWARLGKAGETAGKDSRPDAVVSFAPTEDKESCEDVGQITMYSTPWCGYCKRLKSQMSREGITFDEIDIEQKPDAADYVMSVNGGNQTVPTVVVVAPGGKQTVMTNPSLAQVKAASV
jgi:mycoredoxin